MARGCDCTWPTGSKVLRVKCTRKRCRRESRRSVVLCAKKLKGRRKEEEGGGREGPQSNIYIPEDGSQDHDIDVIEAGESREETKKVGNAVQ